MRSVRTVRWTDVPLTIMHSDVWEISCTEERLEFKMRESDMTGFAWNRDMTFRWTGQRERIMHGEITLRWKKEKDGITISGNVPVNTEAVLVLPDGSEKKLKSGKFEIKNKSII